MKYHIVVDVPDNCIVDDRLDASVRYMALDKSTNKLESKEESGNLVCYSPIDSDTLSKLDVNDNSVIVFKYSSEMDPSDVKLIRDLLQVEFPSNTVLGITSEIDVLSMYPKEAIEMLEKMIAHIKIVNV